jgi:hypothetical protein
MFFDLGSRRARRSTAASSLAVHLYVLVDGDATYDAASARTMIARLTEDRLDMVVAVRVEQDRAAYRPGHRSGNRLLAWFLTSAFGAPFTDQNQRKA